VQTTKESIGRSELEAKVKAVYRAVAQDPTGT
jgi:hypothetical protein